MKKILCLLVSVVMVFTSCILATYAANDNKGNQGNKNAAQAEKTADSPDEETPQEETDSTSLEALRARFKEQHKNKEYRKAILLQIIELRKQNNDSSTPVFVNGSEVEMDTPPVIKSGRTLIPVRAVTKALGAEVQWDPETQTVTITKGDTVIELVLGSNTANVNGTEVDLGVAAELSNNRTYVPIRFISETFKQSVDWDQDTGTVIIEDETDAADTATEDTTDPEAEEEPEEEAEEEQEESQDVI